MLIGAKKITTKAKKGKQGHVRKDNLTLEPDVFHLFSYSLAE
jgi:hypothetical protein